MSRMHILIRKDASMAARAFIQNEIRNPVERDSKLDNYWNLMPPATTDTQLRKIAKSNLTVARIVDEWRKKWQTSNRWTIAQIDEVTFALVF